MAAARASSRNRLRTSPPSPGPNSGTFNATIRRNWVSSARKTDPIPPWPSLLSRLYRPNASGNVPDGAHPGFEGPSRLGSDTAMP